MDMMSKDLPLPKGAWLEVKEFQSDQRLAAEGAVLSIRNGGRVFLPAKKESRGLENPRSV